uniref:Uncharacterized protein n=1 Tax=Leersia perrieri TaxID=77586 RepID=A0A0D9XY74_9ORYZ
MVHRAADHDQVARRRPAQQMKEEVVRLACNKGKSCRFKKSCFVSKEDDAASAAMLLVACVVCSPSSRPLS